MSLHLRKERLENITATEMSAILGVNPYNTAASVLAQKENPVQVESIHLRRGHLMEPSVLEALRMDLGWQCVRHEEGTLVMPDHRIAATPDAYTENKEKVVECKSIGYKSFRKWYKEIPPHYHVQVLVQLLVTGTDVGYIAALEAGDPYDSLWPLVVWEVPKIPEIEEIMKEETKKFWEIAASGKKPKTSSKLKTHVLGLLKNSATLIYPDDPPKEDEDAEISAVLSLFQ